jgi:hypothetical protein
MENRVPVRAPESPRARLHPLLAVAAGAVILVSVTGVAALIGVLPARTSAPVASATAASNQLIPPASAPVVATTPVTNPAAVPEASPTIHPPEKQPRTPVRHRDVAPAQHRAVAHPPASAATPPIDPYAGYVMSVEPVQIEPTSTGLGAIGGAAAGALAGRQFGNGRGKTVATIMGGLAGALGGNMAENRIRSSTVWRVHLQMEDGSSRVLTYPTQPSVYAGQRVHVKGDVLSAG